MLRQEADLKKKKGRREEEEQVAAELKAKEVKEKEERVADEELKAKREEEERQRYQREEEEPECNATKALLEAEQAKAFGLTIEMNQKREDMVIALDIY